jgi:DNA mismatch repair protein MutS
VKAVDFRSILFPTEESDRAAESGEAADVFGDLQLDQIVDRATARFRDFDLRPLFRIALNQWDDIAYRQEVFRDLESPDLMKRVVAFTRAMHGVRADRELAEKAGHRYEKERWLLSAAHTYCSGVQHLLDGLGPLQLRSRGLRAFRDHLAGYVESDGFRALAADVTALSADLAAVRYSLRIKGGSVTVAAAEDQPDYSEVITELFERFTPGAPPAGPPGATEPAMLDHVQARVVERVALLRSDVFRALEGLPARHPDWLDDRVARFDREIHFYIAYLGLTGPLREQGLHFCYPTLCAFPRSLHAAESFDLALALKLAAEGRRVVPNGFRLGSPERVLVVTGPNHGGKTTFARMFGQLHWLARLGCPVPGEEAQLALCDRLFTHFERQEELRTHRGKLHDDLVRIRRILDRATPSSVIVMNEVFSSTTLKDAVYLGSRIMEQISRRDLIAVCVTFLDELASFDEKTVSMVAAVDPEDPSVRTFRIERRSADGLAYALSVAEKHRVTYEWLMRRIGP